MTTLAPSSPSSPSAPPDGSAAADRQVVAMIVAIELFAALGFFAVMTHLVAHLRHDLGLLAGTVGLVMGVRIAVQYTLLLPVGTVIDLLGAARAGALACALRAAGFTLLGSAGTTPVLIGAAVLLGLGGALFHPAAQSLMAGLHPARRARGFAAYIATQQAVSAAVQPWVAAHRRGERRWVLRAGFLLSGSAYLVLAWLDGTASDLGPLLAAAVLAGAASGLLQAATFQRITRLAAPERFGSYFGMTAFASGACASLGGMSVGRLFDLGATAATLALVALAALAAVAAAGIRPIPADRQ